MNAFAKTFELGDIVERVYPKLSKDIEFTFTDDELNSMVNFSIDSKGSVRKGLGIVSMMAETEFDPNYVPANRYSIDQSPWNSHSLYFEIELPNPAENFDYYVLVRTAMLNELTVRLNRCKKNAQARFRRETKKTVVN